MAARPWAESLPEAPPSGPDRSWLRRLEVTPREAIDMMRDVDARCGPQIARQYADHMEQHRKNGVGRCPCLGVPWL
jgi:hypothetical protein